MKKFCEYCGKELKEDADVCLHCGKNVNKQEEKKIEEKVSKEKIPGNGKSIAGMVLGIVATFYAFCELLSLGAIGLILDEFKYSLSGEFNSLAFIYFWFAFGYTFLSLVPSLVGLPLSISGLKKKKTGKNTAGIILNIIGLVISILMYLYILSFI